MSTKMLTEDEFRDIYSRVPRLCADLVIETPTGLVLTLRKLDSWNNLWHLPGGTVFYKETIEQAVNRIAKEEINVQVTIKKLLGYMEFPSEEKARGFGWSIGLVVLCEIVEGQLKKNEETSDVKIFSRLPENMIPEHVDFLKSIYPKFR